MAIRPQSIKLTCTQCDWHKVVAPKSDVVPNDYVLEHCPKCGAKLHRKQLTGLLSALIRVLTR